MMHGFRRPSGPAPAAPYLVSPRSSAMRSSATRAMQMTAWLALPVILVLAAGCSGGSDKKPKQSTSVAQSDQSQEEEKDAAPAPQPAKRKAKVEAKPEEPEPPAASTTDIKKWKLDDLNAALLRKDVQFIFGVAFFGMSKPNDAKRAEELDSLVKKVAKLKDDPVPEIPLPAGSLAEADTDEPLDAAAAKPGTPAAAAAADAPRRGGSPFRRGGGFGRRGGDGGK